MSEMAEAIRQLIQEKGYSEDSVKQTIEKADKGEDVYGPYDTVDELMESLNA